MECLNKAMKSCNTCLTYTALAGIRKQDVGDAERLLSQSVADFLRENEYSREADYIETILDWHRSADERGLTQLERCRMNYRFLNMILNELMPWFTTNYDFSTLEVTRYGTSLNVLMNS